MKLLQQTLTTVAAALDRAGIEYMVIGGMSRVIWGTPRATTDVDLTVGVDHEHARELIEVLREQIAVLPRDLNEYLAGGLLPFTHKSGVHVDLLLSRHPYATLAMERAIAIDVLGTPVKFCTPEDLILHKIISERDRDRDDVADIIRRRRETLDREYLDPRVHELAIILEQPEIEERYRSFFSVTRS